MHFYLSLICALIDAVASQMKTTGNFYKVVGPSKGIEVDSGSLLLEEAFFKCDGSDSCKTVFKAKDSDKLKLADYKLEEAKVQMYAAVYEQEPTQGKLQAYLHSSCLYLQIFHYLIN